MTYLLQDVREKLQQRFIYKSFDKKKLPHQTFVLRMPSGVPENHRLL